MAQNYTKKQVLEAIKNSHGIVSTIADKLKCAWHTADTYVKKWDETLKAYEDEGEKYIDSAESVINKALKNDDVQAAKYVLSTKGKKRGYNEKQEIEHTGNISFELVSRRKENKN